MGRGLAGAAARAVSDIAAGRFASFSAWYRDIAAGRFVPGDTRSGRFAQYVPAPATPSSSSCSSPRCAGESDDSPVDADLDAKASLDDAFILQHNIVFLTHASLEDQVCVVA